MTNRNPATPPAGTLPLAAEQIARLRDLLARYCGVYLDDARRKVIEQALARRLAEVGESSESYIRRVATPGGRGELQQLAELALNHETYFFRNGPQFEALCGEILPALHRSRPAGQPLRIWSAGCATGEEAFSLAICAHEVLGTPLQRAVDIWATDLSSAALRRAAQGRYGGRALAQVSPALLGRYFTPDSDAYLVSAAARSLVRFEQLNLLDAFPPQASGIDLIFCQNVTIYFQLETCRELIDRFYRALPEGGMLFLGFSETLWQIDDRFQLRQIGGAFVYLKGAQAASPLRSAPGPAQAAPSTPQRKTNVPAPMLPPRAPAPEALIEQAQTLLAQGQSEGALSCLRQISPASARYPAALALLARAHADRGDLDTAVAEARRAIDIDPLTEEAYLLLGLIHLRQRQLDQAIAQLERARYLNAQAPLTRFHLAEAYRQSGRSADARREYANVLYALSSAADDQLLDGASVDWLRKTCQRYLSE